MHGRACRGSHPQDPRLHIELLQDRPDGAVPATGHVDDPRQVLAAEAIDVGGRQRVKVDARFEVCDHAQEREEEADFGTCVESRGAGEPPRDPSHVEGAQDRVGLGIRANEDSMVTRRGSGLDSPADLRGKPIGFFGTRGERLKSNRSRCVADAVRAQPLADAGTDLEAIRDR